MKKIIKITMVFTIACISIAALAQHRERGDRDDRGQKIVRITIGNNDERDMRMMSQRIMMLEQAVRGLQNRVFELEEDQIQQPQHQVVCILSTPLETIQGIGNSQFSAEADARRKCERSIPKFTCDQARLRCER